MRDFFKTLFCDDWILVWSDWAEWNVTVHGFTGKYKEDRLCFYKIFYSKHRNEYRLKTSGYDPKKHTYYNTALQKLIQFNKETLK